MAERPTISEFASHVFESFSYLTSEFGFKVRLKDKRLEPFHVLFESRRVFVSVRGINFGSGNETRIGVKPYKDRYSGWPLELIIDLRNPELHPKSMWEWEGQLKQIEEDAHKLQSVCLDLLQGDLSARHDFDDAVESVKQEKAKAWEEYEEELKHTRAIQNANVAFRQKIFSVAVKELNSVRQRLSPAERKKLEYASKKMKEIQANK